MKVAIVGASGYTGFELIKLLLNHPYFEITTLFGSEGGERIEDIYPALRGVFEKEVKKTEINEILKHDLVFFSSPS